jgi:hypothetical protein
MPQHSIQGNILNPMLDASVMDDQAMAERFEIVRCRGKKFMNHEEDSSEVDSISDCPEVMELFRFFHNCDKNNE